jgi:hypothetical protein
VSEAERFGLRAGAAALRRSAAEGTDLFGHRRIHDVRPACIEDEMERAFTIEHDVEIHVVLAERDRDGRRSFSILHRKIGWARLRPRQCGLRGGRIERYASHDRIAVVAIARINVDRVGEIEPTHAAIIRKRQR